MAPLATYIALIKGWHALAVIALALMFTLFTVDRAASTAEILRHALFALVALPVMAFCLGFLVFFTFSFRQHGAGQIFPSALIVVSVFVAVGIAGAMLDDPKVPARIVIPMGMAVSLIMSGLLVGIHFVARKMGG